MLLSISLTRQPLLVFGAGVREGALEEARREAAARVERIVSEHVDAVWRTARRLGVPRLELEDIAQEVMLVAVRRLVDIDVERERAFLIATTVRVTSNWRRARRRRPEELTDRVDELASGDAGTASALVESAEQALERSRKLEVLRRALAEMTEPQQFAFIMFELEQMTAGEIARELGLPEATVVSRVRRAREVFRRCRERASTERVAPGPEGRETAPEGRGEVWQRR